MKHTLSILSILFLLFGAQVAFADETQVEVPAVEQAASAPDAAPAAQVTEAAAAPAPAVLREGYIYKMQECGDGHTGKSSFFGNLFKGVVTQVSEKTGAALLGQVVAAEVVGNVVGDAVDGGQEKRQVCVTVSFRDGTEDQMTKVPGSRFDQLRLRIRRPVTVSFVADKPVDYQF